MISRGGKLGSRASVYSSQGNNTPSCLPRELPLRFVYMHAPAVAWNSETASGLSSRKVGAERSSMGFSEAPSTRMERSALRFLGDSGVCMAHSATSWVPRQFETAPRSLPEIPLLGAALSPITMLIQSKKSVIMKVDDDRGGSNRDQIYGRI